MLLRSDVSGSSSDTACVAVCALFVRSPSGDSVLQLFRIVWLFVASPRWVGVVDLCASPWVYE